MNRQDILNKQKDIVREIVNIAFNPELYTDFDKEREEIIASPLWNIAFIHKTTNQNTNKNYEKLEFLGDKVLGLCFTRYLMKKYPNINENQLNNFITNYLSTKLQADISDIFELSKALVAPYHRRLNIIPTIKEDLLESIYGALFESANNVNIGYGFQGVYNLTVIIFESLYPIDIEYAFDDPRQTLNEIITNIDGYIEGDYNRMYTKIKRGDEWKVTISLPPNIQMFILDAIRNEKGANLEEEFWSKYKDELVSTTDKDINIATKNAAIEALSILESYGFGTNLLIRNLNHVKDIPRSLERKVYEKMQKEGHVDLVFPYTGVQLLQLVAISEDYIDGYKVDIKKIIGTEPIRRNDNINRLKLNLLNKYVA